MTNDGRSGDDQTINAVLHALENDRRQASDHKDRTLKLVLDQFDRLASESSKTEADVVDVVQIDEQRQSPVRIWPRLVAAAAVILLFVAVVQVRDGDDVVSTTNPSIPTPEEPVTTDPPRGDLDQSPAALLPELPDGLVILEQNESLVTLVAEGEVQDPQAAVTLIDLGEVDINAEIESLLDRKDLSGFRSQSSVQERIFPRWELSVSGLITEELICHTSQPCVEIGNGVTLWIGQKNVVHVLTTESGRNLAWVEQPWGGLESLAGEILNQIDLG